MDNVISGPMATKAMSGNQEEHLRRLKNQAMALIDGKYRRGAAVHGGNLCKETTLCLLDAGIEEAVDQVVYLLTAREKLLEMLDQLEELRRKY
jgi:hypothetical protein